MLLDVKNITSGDARGGLFFLDSEHIAILRALAAYASRNIQWLSENIDDANYLSPDGAEWDGILAIVAELEYRLMTPIDVSGIIDAVDRNTEALDGLLCICEGLSNLSSGLSYPSPGDEFAWMGIADGHGLVGDEADVAAIMETEINSDACQFANAAFEYYSEWLRETFLPAAESAGGALALAITTTAAFTFLTAGLGLAPSIIAGVFIGVVAFVMSQSSSNLENALFGLKEEITCEFYRFASGSQDWRTTQVAVTGIIEASGLPRGDKMMLKLAYTAEYYLRAIEYAIDNELISTVGYPSFNCATCDFPDDCVDFCDERIVFNPPIAPTEDCWLDTTGMASGALACQLPASPGLWEVTAYVTGFYSGFGSIVVGENGGDAQVLIVDTAGEWNFDTVQVRVTAQYIGVYAILGHQGKAQCIQWRRIGD